MKLLVLLAGLVVVSHAANIPLTWQIPTNNQPYPTETLMVGDTITFVWGGGPPHGVYALADGPAGAVCPESFPDGPATLAAVAPGGSYVYTATAPGTYNLACQVGDHCEDGMLIQIIVGGGAPAPAPGLAPSAAVGAMSG